MRGVILTALLAAAAGSPAMAFADDTAALAQSLGDAAARKSVKRVAVIPFVGPRGTSSYSGSVLSARLVTVLLSRGGLDVVERPMLESILSEQKLGLFGVMDPATAKAVGKVLGVDAILTGTVVELRGDKAELNARLIHVETAQVLAAATARIPKDWDEPSDIASADVLVPVPSLGSGAPALAWRDSLNDGEDACAARENRLERELLDLKARFWVAKLKDPTFTAARITRNPGSEIRDPGLRDEFYERLRALYYSGDATPLSGQERASLANGLEDLRALTRSCED